MYYLLLLRSNKYDRYGIVLSHFFNEFNYSEQPKIIDYSLILFIITLVEAYMSHFDAYSILTVS